MHLIFEKSLCLPILKIITEIITNFKSLYGFRGRCLEIRDVWIDFEPYFKVQNLVSVQPKSIILGKLPISTWSFMWWCQFIDLLKFEIRPNSLLNFGTTNYCCNFGSFVNKSDYIVKTYWMQLETIALLTLYYYISEVFTGQNVRRKLCHGCCVKVWFALRTVAGY